MSLNVNIKSNIKDVTAKLSRYQKKQIPFATSKALNDVAFDARKEALEQMPKKLDRPTKFTTSKGAVRVKKSTKTNLTSEVYLNKIQAGYLTPQIKGGTYKPKRSVHVVPAGEKLNKFGNIARAKRKKYQTNKQKYFSGVPKGTNQEPGVFERYGSKKNPKFKRVAVYKEKTTYKKRYDFPKIVGDVVAKNFKKIFRKQLNSALATAK